MRSQVWKFMEISVINWWRNNHQSSTSKSLRLLRFCVVSWKGPSTSAVQRSLEEQNCRVKSMKSSREYDGISGEQSEFEWNIFPGFTTLQLYGKVTDSLSRLGETPERCATTFLVEQRTMKKNVWHMLKSSLCLQESVKGMYPAPHIHELFTIHKW